jgi:hypothetical protein
MNKDNPHIHGKPDIVPVEGLVVDCENDFVFKYEWFGKIRSDAVPVIIERVNNGTDKNV